MCVCGVIFYHLFFIFLLKKEEIPKADRHEQILYFDGDFTWKQYTTNMVHIRADTTSFCVLQLNIIVLYQ